MTLRVVRSIPDPSLKVIVEVDTPISSDSGSLPVPSSPPWVLLSTVRVKCLPVDSDPLLVTYGGGDSPWVEPQLPDTERADPDH